MNKERNLIFNPEKIRKMYSVRRILHRPRPYTNNPLILGTEFADREKLQELEQGGKKTIKEAADVDQHTRPKTKSGKGHDLWFVPAQFGARVVYPASVIKSPDTGIYQMYYWVNGGLNFEDSGWSGGSSVICYAESRDGINWTLPILDKIQVFGSSENNVLFPPGNYPYIILNKDLSVKDKRYIAFIHPGPRIAFSADGKNWSEQEKAYIETDIGRSDGDTILGWDCNVNKYVAYLRPWRAHPNEPEDTHFSRKIGRAESEDLIHWSNHKCILCADQKDAPWTELERMLVFKYGGIYLGLLVVFNTYAEQRHAISHMIGTTYVELAYSNDGVNWNRFDEREPFLSYKPGVKDFGLTIPAHQCLEIDNELYFYYESTNLHHAQFPYGARLQLAKLTRDRFVGLRADDKEGYIETSSFICPGGNLMVNADLKNGYLRAAVLKEDGFHSMEHSVYRSNYIEGESPEHRIKWINTDNLNSLKNKKISLKFYLKNSEIFSYWFENSDAGARIWRQ